MPKGSITLQIKNYENLQKTVKDMNKPVEKALQRTMSDLKKQGPTVVRKQVTAVYNINKKEIQPGAVKKGKDGSIQKIKQAANIKTEGKTVDTFTMIYTGRLLTPVHFSMTPKAPKANGNSYNLYMTVLKGKKELIGRYKKKRIPNGPYSKRSHNILMSTGNTRSGGTNYIPFQRMSERRLDLKKFTTISVPQMIDNPKVNEAIYTDLMKYAVERLNKHSASFIGK